MPIDVWYAVTPLPPRVGPWVSATEVVSYSTYRLARWHLHMV